jgi:replicative DNA helicase
VRPITKLPERDPRSLSHQLEHAVRELREIAAEQRSQVLPWACLMPSDIDAEQEIAALLLSGQRAPEQLEPLRSHHFFASLFANIFDAAGAVVARGEGVEYDAIAAELERRGMSGLYVAELAQIRDTTPFINDLQLRRQITRLMELSAQRRLLRAMHACDIALRTGELDCDGVRARLESFFFEVLG